MAENPRELLALAVDLVRQAGAMVRDGRRRGLREVEMKTTRTDMVTEYDHASEALVVEGLRAARPHDAVVGEEGTARAGTTGIAWLLDPIDGTTNYLYDLPGYAVSLAAVDEEGALVGAVDLPVLGETFTAVRGGGAFLNGRPIRCSDRTELASALVATGFSYQAEIRKRQACELAEIIGAVRDIRRLGAASADLCFVACGRFDAYYEEGLKPWDLAAGELVAREAGAITGDYEGRTPRQGQILAATPALFEPLRRLLASVTAARPPSAATVTRPPAT